LHAIVLWWIENSRAARLKRQLMGHFPNLWHRLVWGRAIGCKNFCLKKSSRKWGTSCHTKTIL